MKHKIARKQLSLLTAFSLMGSFLIIAGTLLPWFSFLGGLQTFSGIAGLNGKILLLMSMVSLLCGILLWVKKYSFMQWTIGILGFIQLVFCSYLLINLYKTFQNLSADAMNGMMAARIGPGLFIATFGSLVIFSTLFLPRKEQEVTVEVRSKK